MYVIHYIDAKH